MAVIEHITIQKTDTKANILALGTYIPKHFYFCSDTDEYYFGNNAGTGLLGPIPGTANVGNLVDGDTIDFTDNGGGNWTAEVIRDGTAGNILQVSSNGIYVPDDYIRSVDNAASSAIDLTVTSGALQADIKTGVGISVVSDAIAIDLTGGGPIDISGNTISLNTNNTDSIDLSVNGGNLEADLNIASGGAHADNIASIVTGKGLYVPDDYIKSVANTSSLNLTVDVNGELTGIVNNVAITDVVVDTTEVSMSAWIGSNYTGPEYGEGDVVILTNVPDGRESWINNGGTNSDITDWTLLEDAHITDSQVRALFSGGDSLTYNSTTGEFNVIVSGDSGNDLSLGTDDSLFLDVSNSPITDTNSFTTGGDTVQDFFDEITSAIQNNNSSINQPSNQIVYGTGTGLGSESGFEYNPSTNKMTINGDLDFTTNGNGFVHYDSVSTSWKSSVTTYGALVLTS